MPSTSPKPNLGKSTALTKSQATVARLAAIVPTLTTEFSPVTVYQPAIEETLLSTVSTTGGIGTPGTTDMGAFYGVWVAPDLLGNGQDYFVQVECFGAGGGAGGGNISGGGGGGGGGAYSSEPSYPITPGQQYTYVVGFPGTGGLNTPTNPGVFNVPGSAGTTGGTTIFDTAGLGLAGGVVANGGQGGDQTATGIGGSGGVISNNTISFAGGAGGTNASGNGSDNPIALAKTNAMFVGNTKNANIIKAWYIFNDGPDSTFEFNDSSTFQNTATVTTSSSGINILQGNAPAQVPAYTTSAGSGQPNPTRAGCSSLWNGKVNSVYAGYSQSPTFTFAGTKLTVSCWLQCDPTGTWGNNAANSTATVCANSKNYWTFNAFVGFGMFFLNTGTAAAPNWFLYVNWGNNTVANFTRVSMPPVVGTWYYVVATFNSGTITLYVNGVSVASGAAGFSSLPGAAYNMRVGTDPAGTYSYFFGYISNIWFADDVAQPALMTAAMGGVSPTGGAGGGASAGPSAVGGVGQSAALGVGGAGGANVTQPPALANTTTPSQGGYAGSAAGAGNPSPSAPAGGTCGGGGGAAGDMMLSPNITVLTVPFVSAATYNGIDAAQNPGNIYNVNQQNNPASGVNSVLYAGGLPTDSSTGSKNSLLLLPPGLAAHLSAGQWLIQQVFLTFTNAYPTNTQESLLEVFWSGDTSLPQTYSGADSNGIVGALPIPIGSGTLTYDITEAGLAVFNQPGLQSGFCTAFILGALNDPTFDAYNAQTGPDFYASIYGPGAMDQFGNSQQPYLTLVLAKTPTFQQGSNAAGGGIVVSFINQEEIPIATVEPFATTDEVGNAFAQGFTGQIACWNPASVLAGPPYSLETWHVIAPSTGSNQAGDIRLQYRATADGMVQIVGTITNGSSMSGGTLFTLPAAWRPATNTFVPCAFFPAADGDAYLTINSSGAVTINTPTAISGTQTLIINGAFPLGIT